MMLLIGGDHYHLMHAVSHTAIMLTANASATQGNGGATEALAASAVSIDLH